MSKQHAPTRMDPSSDTDRDGPFSRYRTGWTVQQAQDRMDHSTWTNQEKSEVVDRAGKSRSHGQRINEQAACTDQEVLFSRYRPVKSTQQGQTSQKV